MALFQPLRKTQEFYHYFNLWKTCRLVFSIEILMIISTCYLYLLCWRPTKGGRGPALNEFLVLGGDILRWLKIECRMGVLLLANIRDFS